jgi:endonuclease III
MSADEIIQDSLVTRQKRALEVIDQLKQYYGDPSWRNPLPALDELVSTILSQNTNDHNRDAAYLNLRTQLPTWESVRDAPTEQVIASIRSAGLANQKGPRIQRVLQEISMERGCLDLDFLLDWDIGQARQWLQHFKGVGPKTAAIVLCFSLGKPAFPVDTHIYRVTGRLGLRDVNLSVERTHMYLERVFPPESFYPVHLNLIRLGREVCHPRKPDCPTCPLNQLCPTFKGRSSSSLGEN